MTILETGAASILAGQRFAALDIETTGWSHGAGHSVLEVGIAVIDSGEIVDGWASLVGPRRPIAWEATRVHGISEAMLDQAPEPGAVAKRLRSAAGDLPLVFHNASFDVPFLTALFRENGEPPLWNAVIDTLGLSRGLFGSGGNSLGELAARFALPAETAHRALGDARTTARLLLALAPLWERDRGVRSVDELAATSQDAIRESARRAAALRRAQAAGVAAGT